MTKHPTDHPFFIARVYAFRGDPNEALKWLDLAYAQKDSGMLPLIKGDAMFRKIEGDPRYKGFLKKMNCPSSAATRQPLRAGRSSRGLTSSRSTRSVTHLGIRHGSARGCQ